MNYLLTLLLLCTPAQKQNVHLYIRLSYVQDIQRMERKEGVELLKHQKWSGAELVDKMVSVASGGRSSTAAMGAGVTEDQFSSKM